MVSVRVLMYQKIGKPPHTSSLKKEWTSPARLTHTLNKIKKRGFVAVSPSQILAGDLPEKPVLLLFLDGYRSFYEHVYPLLKEYNLCACVCLPTACVGTYNSWQDPHQEPWQDLLTWDEVNTLAQDPLISFGAQALEREDLTLLSAEQARYNAQESLFRLRKMLPKPPELMAVAPAQKKVENETEILPCFDGLIVSQNKNITKNFPTHVKIICGNSLRAHWMWW